MSSQTIQPDNLPDNLKDTYRHLLVIGENYKGLWDVVKRYEDEFLPAGGVEDFLFTDLIANHWRIWRLQAMETAVVNEHMEQQGAPASRFVSGGAVLACQNIMSFSGILPLLNRLEAQARRAWQSAMRFFLKYRGQLAKFRKDPPPAVRSDGRTHPQTVADNPTQNTLDNEKERPCNPQPEPSPVL